VKGVTRANISTVSMNSTGKLAVYNAAGSANVVVDVVGFYGLNATAPANAGAGNEFTSLRPTRLLDTRGSTDGPLASQDGVVMYADFGVPTGALNASVKAVALNITATGAKSGGFLAAWDGGGTLPTTSTLNFSTATTANMAVVKTSVCNECDAPKPVQFGVYNGSSVPVEVIVDLVGVYYNDGTEGLRFTPVAPKRISDSRSSLNGKPLTAGQTQTLTAPSSVAGAATDAVVANTTALTPSSGTFLAFWRAGESRPLASNLNAPAKTTVANGAVLGLSSANKFNVFNNLGTTNFVIDVTGKFDAGTVAAGTLAASKASSFEQVSSTSVRRAAAAR
jgi:hypothetical protein